MKWPTICEHYPKTWVLVEALEATSVNNKRDYLLSEIGILMQ